MTTQSFPANAVNLFIGTTSDPLAGSMTVTMKTARYYTDGTRMAKGADYIVTRTWGRMAVDSGWATDTGGVLPQQATPAVGGTQYIFPSLTANDLSSANANTTTLLTLAAQVRNLQSPAEIYFPSGVIYYNQVISWTISGNEAVPVVPGAEARWPLFKSMGRTSFQWSGAAINGGTWRFSHATTAIISTSLRFEGIEWVGPGVSVGTSRAVATSALGQNSASVILNNASNVSVGDAIVIGFDARAGSTFIPTSPPWWATVQSVSGNTVTFLPAMPATGTFAASVGNVVQIMKQTRAIEIGGQTAARQDIFFDVQFIRCAFVDWMSGVATQDVTAICFDEQCNFNRVMFDVEEGYNTDSFMMIQPMHLCQVNSRTGTVVSGQKTITALSFTSDLKPGMGVSDITAPATAQAFPEWAVIETVDSASQVTMSHNSSLSGSRTFQPVMGWLLAQGSGFSPWYPREAGFDGFRSNCDCTEIISPVVNHARGFYCTDSITNSAIVVKNAYSELNQRLAFIGHVAGNTSRGPYHFVEGGILSGQTAFTGPCIESLGGGVNVKIEGYNQAGPLAFALQASEGGSSQVTTILDHCAVTTSASGLIMPDTYYFNGINPPSGVSSRIDINGSASSGLMATVTGAGNINQETWGWDGVHITMTADSTLKNQPYGTPQIDRRYRVIAVQNNTGGFSLTLESNFCKADGTAIGTIAAGTANKVCIMDFIGVSNGNGKVKYMLVAGAASFIALA